VSDKTKNRIMSQLMTRRDMLKTMAAGSAAGLIGMGLPGTLGGAPLSAAPNRPNIVFILSDNCRPDFMGFTVHPFIKTPAIDALAARGISFDNAFCTTSLCSPSRASFLTGAYAHNHGVLNNHMPWTGDRTMFLEHLSRAGYDTAFIGKFHMPGNGLPDLPFLDTFVSFDIKENQGQYFDCPLIVDGKPEPSRKPYLIEELTDRALEYIGREHENPFCLYLSYKTAHFPFLPPKDLAGIYANEKVDLPPEADSWLGRTNGNVFEGTMVGSLDALYRRYGEAITGMDREIGRLVDTIDSSPLADNTVVIYASDNGYMWGEHRIIGINWHYEESIRIPFVVRCPWLIPDPGTRRSQMLLNIDLAPTVLEIAGVPVPADIDGQSAVPVLRDGGTPGRSAWFYEYYKFFPENVPTMQGVRTRTRMYVEFEKGMRPQLFDLVRDPGEHVNLFGTPEGDRLVPEMRAMMEHLKAGGRL
jgi:arylsulfatase A-like enzyme